MRNLGDINALRPRSPTVCPVPVIICRTRTLAAQEPRCHSFPPAWHSEVTGQRAERAGSAAISEALKQTRLGPAQLPQKVDMIMRDKEKNGPLHRASRRQRMATGRRRSLQPGTTVAADRSSPRFRYSNVRGAPPSARSVQIDLRGRCAARPLAASRSESASGGLSRRLTYRLPGDPNEQLLSQVIGTPSTDVMQQWQLVSGSSAVESERHEDLVFS